MECPVCGSEVIVGADQCDGCQSDLTHLDDPLNQSGIHRRILQDPIEDLKPSPAMVIPKNEVLSYCIKILQNNKIGCLVVINEDGKVCGVVTERDLLFKVANTNANLDTSTVDAVMTANPECLSPADNISYALHKMGHGGYRHIPLVDDERRPCGILSVKDIMEYIVSVWDDDITEADVIK